MGMCQYNCQKSNELYSTIKIDKRNIKIECLDEHEHNLLNDDKQIAATAQRLINNSVHRTNRSSLNPSCKNITNNIILNNIILIPHSQSEVCESDKSEEYGSKNSISSINIKRRPIFAKLNTKRSSKQ